MLQRGNEIANENGLILVDTNMNLDMMLMVK